LYSFLSHYGILSGGLKLNQNLWVYFLNPGENTIHLVIIRLQVFDLDLDLTFSIKLTQLLLKYYL